VLREVGRTAAGIAVGTVATGALIVEGFYDWGVIGKAAWDATSSDDCECGN
jgi:ABC-type dipeptide/oligopeptide/nickel transport system permease component